MTDPLAHLEDAETSIMSFISRLNSTPEDAPEESQPDVLAVLMATLRSVSRAAGALEVMELNHYEDDELGPVRWTGAGTEPPVEP